MTTDYDSVLQKLIDLGYLTYMPESDRQGVKEQPCGWRRFFLVCGKRKQRSASSE
jgi:hypothetical protein